MSEFRLIQITDTHLSAGFPQFVAISSASARSSTRQSLTSSSIVATLPSMARAIPMTSPSPGHSMTPFPSPAAICRAITTSATTRLWSPRRQAS
jgi:hypothetical protein